jgi:glutathione synthase/RimK-type ligase-like ATP-grasp enzyme
MVRLGLSHWRSLLDHCRCGFGSSKLLTFALLPVRALFDDRAFNHATEGGAYNLFSLLGSYYPVVAGLSDKVVMHYFLVSRGVPVPALYGYSTGPSYLSLIPLEEGVRYICKPRGGCLGAGVRVVTASDAVPPDHLVQQRLRDCSSSGTRHYRVVTMHDGRVFATYRLTQPEQQVAASNHGAGGRVEVVDGVPDVLAPVVEKLRHLHRESFESVLSLGWDVMVDCDDDEEVRVLEFNFGHSAHFADETEELADAYKEEARVWHARLCSSL